MLQYSGPAIQRLSQLYVVTMKSAMLSRPGAHSEASPKPRMLARCQTIISDFEDIKICMFTDRHSRQIIQDSINREYFQSEIIVTFYLLFEW